MKFVSEANTDRKIRCSLVFVIVFYGEGAEETYSSSALIKKVRLEW